MSALVKLASMRHERIMYTVHKEKHTIRYGNIHVRALESHLLHMKKRKIKRTEIRKKRIWSTEETVYSGHSVGGVSSES